MKLNFNSKYNELDCVNEASSFAYDKGSVSILKIYKELLDIYLRSSLNEQTRSKIKNKFFDFFKTQGNESIHIKNYDNAIIFFKEALHNNPYDVTSLNNIGLAFINKNLYVEAKFYLEQAIKISPDTADILNNLGMVLTKIGEIKKSKKFLLKAIQINPKYVSAKLNLGILYLAIDQYENAIVQFKEMIIINCIFSPAYQYLSKTYRKMNKFSEALKINKQAILMLPYHSDTYNSMGISYKELQNHPKAINLFKQSLKLNQNNINALNNLANTYLKTGQINKAIETYIEVLQIKFPFHDSSKVLLSILIQKGQTSNTLYSSILVKIEMSAILERNLLSLIYLAIDAFILGKWSKTRSLLEIINQHNLEKEIYEEEEPNKYFIIAYAKYLNSLILTKNNLIDSNKLVNKNVIYHIGDSHALSFAHKRLKNKEHDNFILPRIIFGAKAFHFGGTKKSDIKFYLNNYIKIIPNKSTVLISFGEIDCRHNEGICNYYRKNNISLDKIIEDTINGFIKFITNECKQKHFNLFFIGVHAPVLNKNISKEDSELQINVINKWNKSLSIILENTEYKFINTYNITANKDGYSNFKYMCDETHLKPDFIEHISQTIV